jgi:hypothetical protein
LWLWPGGEHQVAVFIAVDHHNAECVGIHAARRGTRFEALEPRRPGVRRHFGVIGKEIAHGLAVRQIMARNICPTPSRPRCAFWAFRVHPPLFVRLKATAVRSVSSARSRKTCSEYGPSTPSKNSGSHCSRFATSTTRPGSSSGSPIEPLPRSDRRSFQPSRSPRRLLTDVSLAAGGTGYRY